MCSQVKVTDITVKNYRIFVRVQLSNIKYSNLQIKDRLLKKAPTLKFHECKNHMNQNFEEVLESTSLAHILEHLIIDFQIKYIQDAGITKKPIFGTTEWLDKDSGVAKIEISFVDDIIALKAINSAENLLNECLEN